MSTPRVSVIVPVYNAMPYLTACLESVFRQTLPASHYELIVIDDGSTDGSADEIERLCSGHENVILVRQPNSGGPSRPRNEGLDRACGEYVVFLDADDYLGDEALERMVAYADEHGSDVVVGKMVGVGGREAPQQHLTTNQPRVDLYKSSIYWTLSCLKLFRRDLIEGLGLRFHEDLIYGDDQPFTAIAYFNAQTISVLAEYPCFYIMGRAEGSSVTQLRYTPQVYLRVLEHMFPIVREYLEPGTKRDHIVRRHLQVGVMLVLQSIARHGGAPAHRETIERLTAWLDEFYTRGVASRTDTQPRVAFALLLEGRADDALTVAAEWLPAFQPDLQVIDGHAYERVPFFRTDQGALPDDLYDVTARLRVRHRLASLDCADGVIRLTGAAGIERLDGTDTRVSIALRQRSRDTEYRVPTQPSGESGGFSATIDLATVADGSALTGGIWDVFADVVVQGVQRRVRFGSSRYEGIEARGCATAVVHGNDRRLIAAYFTHPHGNLSIDTDFSKHSPLKVVNVHWEDAARGSLEVTCDVVYPGLKAGPGRLVFSDDQGCEYSFGVHRDAEVDSMVLHGRMMRSLDGGPLPDGVWAVRLELDLEGVPVSAPVRMPARPAKVTWWRRGLPVRASVTKRGYLKVTGFQKRVAGAWKRRFGAR